MSSEWNTFEPSDKARTRLRCGDAVPLLVEVDAFVRRAQARVANAQKKADDLRQSEAELKSGALRIARALGIVHQADFRADEPGSIDEQLAEIKGLQLRAAELDKALAHVRALLELHDASCAVADYVDRREAAPDAVRDRHAAAEDAYPNAQCWLAGLRGDGPRCGECPNAATRFNETGYSLCDECLLNLHPDARSAFRRPWSGPFGCWIENGSSRTCQRGTNSCVTDHDE